MCSWFILWNWSKANFARFVQMTWEKDQASVFWNLKCIFCEVGLLFVVVVEKRKKQGSFHGTSPKIPGSCRCCGAPSLLSFALISTLGAMFTGLPSSDAAQVKSAKNQENLPEIRQIVDSGETLVYLSLSSLRAPMRIQRDSTLIICFSYKPSCRLKELPPFVFQFFACLFKFTFMKEPFWVLKVVI